MESEKCLQIAVISDAILSLFSRVGAPQSPNLGGAPVRSEHPFATCTPPPLPRAVAVLPRCQLPPCGKHLAITHTRTLQVATHNRLKARPNRIGACIRCGALPGLHHFDQALFWFALVCFGLSAFVHA